MQDKIDVRGQEGSSNKYWDNQKIIRKPLINRKGEFVRALGRREMARVLEIREHMINPGKSNAPNIPCYLYLNPDKSNDAEIKGVEIPPDANKYYCHLTPLSGHRDIPGGPLSNNFPNTPKALGQICLMHIDKAMDNLRQNGHSLPVTMIYQIGFNENHVGAVAVRINSLDDPSKNEIMVINSLPGYSAHEDAAVLGLALGLQKNATETHKGKTPSRINITPVEYPSVKQATADMSASCSLISDAIVSQIDPDIPFSEQESRLAGHMADKLVGYRNERRLREEYQQVLELTHPSDPGFNAEEASRVLRECPTLAYRNQAASSPRHVPLSQPRSQQTTPTTTPTGAARQKTPEEFVRAMTSKDAIESSRVQLRNRGETLYSVCEKLQDEQVIQDMFKNSALMDAIREEGMEGKLYDKFEKVFFKQQWPDYSKAPPITVNNQWPDYSKAPPITVNNQWPDYSKAPPITVNNQWPDYSKAPPITVNGQWPDYSKAPPIIVNAQDKSEPTPEDFVKAMTSPEIIQKDQQALKERGKDLFFICSNVNDPSTVVAMFKNQDLMKAIRNEGKEQELKDIHHKILVDNLIHKIDDQIEKLKVEDSVHMQNKEHKIDTLDHLKEALVHDNLNEFRQYEVEHQDIVADAKKGVFSNVTSELINEGYSIFTPK